jgi:hypothetical protein
MQTIVYQDNVEDAKGVIRSRKSKKDIQQNSQKKKDKRANNDLQSIHIKLQIEQHEHHLKPGVNLGVSRSCSKHGTCRVTLVTNSVISHEWGQVYILMILRC